MADLPLWSDHTGSCAELVDRSSYALSMDASTACLMGIAHFGKESRPSDQTPDSYGSSTDERFDAGTSMRSACRCKLPLKMLSDLVMTELFFG